MMPILNLVNLHSLDQKSIYNSWCRNILHGVCKFQSSPALFRPGRSRASFAFGSQGLSLSNPTRTHGPSQRHPNGVVCQYDPQNHRVFSPKKSKNWPCSCSLVMAEASKSTIFGSAFCSDDELNHAERSSGLVCLKTTVLRPMPS